MYKVEISIKVTRLVEGNYGWRERDGDTEGRVDMEFEAAGIDQAALTGNGVTTGLIQSAFADHYAKFAIRELESEEGAEE